MSTAVRERTIAELERIRAATPEDEIHFLRERDPEGWHYCIDGAHRELLRRREEREKQPKPKPAAATVPLAQHQREEVANLILKYVTIYARELKKLHIVPIRDALATLASAARVAELTDRVMQLEARIASSEKRAAQHDTAISAHRKHLNNLEIKSNDLKRAMNCEPPSGERIQK